MYVLNYLNGEDFFFFFSLAPISFPFPLLRSLSLLNSRKIPPFLTRHAGLSLSFAPLIRVPRNARTTTDSTVRKFRLYTRQGVEDQTKKCLLDRRAIQWWPPGPRKQRIFLFYSIPPSLLLPFNMLGKKQHASVGFHKRVFSLLLGKNRVVQK